MAAARLHSSSGVTVPQRLRCVGLPGRVHPTVPRPPRASDGYHGPSRHDRHVAHVASPSHMRAPAIEHAAPIALYTQENIAAFLKMARLHNLLPSTLMVLVGAWAGRDNSLAVLFSANVWLMALVSSGISAASMVVNDYFDYVSGIDRLNAPDKPLPAGTIAPDTAILFGALLYMGVLIAACTMEPHGLRLLIAGSAAATMAYTPLLKKWTGVKNVVVAGIIAAALVAGGLAAGAVRAFA